MSVNVNLTDGLNRNKAQIHDDGTRHGLIVFTEDLLTSTPVIGVLFNTDNGIDMNVDGAFGGTPDGIHNGTDSALWTASTLSGTKFTFDSTDRANSGTMSIKTDNGGVGDAFQVLRASTIDLSTFSSISLAVNVDKDWNANSDDSIEFGGYDTGTGLDIGTPVLLENYFNETVTDTWHNLAIPLTDLSLSGTTLDAFKLTVVAKAGKGPKFYMDDIQLEETGGGVSYTLAPDRGKDMYLNSLRFTLADDITALSFDQFMGVSALTTGVTVQLRSRGKIIDSFTITDIGDMVSIGANITTEMTDSTNTMVSLDLVFSKPLVMVAADLDEITININDDLSSLLVFRCIVSGYEVAS